MNIRLDIGPEGDSTQEDESCTSNHMLNLKKVDSSKKKNARTKVSLDLKEEIKSKNEQPGRICIMGELPRSKQGLGRAPMVIAAVLMIFILNFGQLVFLGKQKGGEALALAGEAFVSLQGASQSFISGEEGADMLLFSEAEELFTQAQSKGDFLINYESPWLTEPSEVQSLRNLLEAGTMMAETGQAISTAKQSFLALPDEGSLTDYLKEISQSQLEPAALKITEINTLLDEVDLSGTGYEDKFEDYREKLNALEDVFGLWLDAKDAVLTLLGDRYVQHYLVLLMNNDEMRLGGGFIGSFAILEMNDGRLTDLQFHDVYDFDDRFFEHIEVPIPELRTLTPEWRLRDSNISVDFPSTAEHAIDFLDMEGGPGVDGVIAVNLSAGQAMLEETGPISLASLPKAITAESFPAVMSTLVEAKVSGLNSPKAVLSEFIDAFIQKLDEPNIKTPLALRILDEARKKQLLFYHRDPAVQELIENMGMAASIPKLGELEGDFFLPTFTNIAGNKTDRYMQTGIQHDTHILEDGSVFVSATITRSHTFNAAALAWLKEVTAQYGFTNWTRGLEKVLGNEANRTGIRLYIPEGANIVDVKGDAHRDDLQFYYDPEQDISYHYLDQSIAPGESQSFTVLYTLPQSFDGEFQEYKFQLFKQPGLKSVTFEKTVTAPDDIMLSSYPLATESQVGIDYTYSGSFDKDFSATLLYR